MNGIIGQAQQQQQQNNATYPQNKEEVAQFVNDIMRMIYSEGQPENILDRIVADRNNIPMALGQLAGSLVMTVLVRRQEQTGRKPHFNLLIRGIKKALDEMVDLMQMAGLEQPTPEMMQEAANYAGQIVEQALQGGQQPQQQAPPVQQGGMM